MLYKINFANDNVNPSGIFKSEYVIVDNFQDIFNQNINSNYRIDSVEKMLWNFRIVEEPNRTKYRMFKVVRNDGCEEKDHELVAATTLEKAVNGIQKVRKVLDLNKPCFVLSESI